MDLQKAILLSKKNDPRGQRYIYDTFKSKWYMTCLRYMKYESDADDALQNGMVNIFMKIHLFNEELGSFASWSSRVMVNDCIMLLRKENKRFVHELNDTVYALSDIVESPIERMSSEEILSLVHKLPLGYRTVFNMYVVEGYNHREIGDILGISEGTSKSQLFKARQILQQSLEVLI